jgi:hypothetical protein
MRVISGGLGSDGEKSCSRAESWPLADGFRVDDAVERLL